MTEEGGHGAATFAEAGPAERARLLGVPNIVMAGYGLPRNDDEALQLAERVGHAPRLVWEVACDDEDGGPPYAYGETVARVAMIAEKYPQTEGVLLDDMTSQMIPRGFKPEHIRGLKTLLLESCPQVKVWGVVYTMNLDVPDLEDYIRELDVINLWVWHAKDLADLEPNIRRLEEAFPDKPIVLGLYLYDYGDGRPMPLDVHRRQCAMALRLLQAGRIQDIVFLTITNDEEAVRQTARWVREIAARPLGGAGPDPFGESIHALTMDAASRWWCTGEAWSVNGEGVIRPPNERNLHSRAFYLDKAFGDFEAEFEFNGDYRETGTGTAGLILRAQDANHCYLVHFPWGGQQLRAKHFWAAVAKVEGDGYLRGLEAAWVPGVPSETDRWYRVRVAAQGAEIRVDVDGRTALCVRDAEYETGRVGLAGYGWYAFRNVRIRGNAGEPAPWDDAARVPSHAFPIGLSSEKMPSACIAPNGDVLVAAGSQLVRSTDRARTWGPPEPLPESLGPVTDYGNAMFCAPGGPVSVMLFTGRKDTGLAVPQIAWAESEDNGRTWSEPAPAQVAEGWPAAPASLTPYGPVLVNGDGALLRFLLGRANTEGEIFPDVRTWGAVHCKAYVIRSADRGRSWTAPIEIDRPSWCNAARGEIPGSLDLTEPAAVVMGDTVMAVIRPIYSPYMWQCWSHDGGATWDAAVRATFPGYAESMTRTTSGAIVCAHRYPLYSVNVSRDGGLNWDAGTVIDYPVWAMGTMVEVEPDVVFCTYMNAEQSLPLLAQRVRVTPTRIEPIPAD
ncbi:MAG: exo-alpha-sialidase [Candidatus Hydrogenedentes bacterium]|nr:exo-alpha-sialidase [Candidatus Hydrogenedentota bacterium]